jgi:hypothetical protein
MRMNRHFLFFCLLIFITSCAVDEQSLTGTWKAAAFYENGQAANTALDSVKLVLNADHQYEFHSQGFYKEMGTWKSSVNYLFFTDMSVQPPKEKMLKVLYQSKDSLKLRMEQNGAEQVLFLGRVK